MGIAKRPGDLYYLLLYYKLIYYDSLSPDRKRAVQNGAGMMVAGAGLYGFVHSAELLDSLRMLYDYISGADGVGFLAGLRDGLMVPYNVLLGREILDRAVLEHGLEAVIHTIGLFTGTVIDTTVVLAAMDYWIKRIKQEGKGS